MSSLKRIVRKHIWFHLCKRAKLNIPSIKCRTFCSVQPIESRHLMNAESFIEFDKFINKRRQEAKRSIVVQVKNENSCCDLLTYCKEFGVVKGMHFYSINSNYNLAVVEFEEPEAVNVIINKCDHLDLSQIIPVRSCLVWFKAGARVESKSDNLNSSTANVPNFTKQSISLPTSKEMEDCLKSAKSFSDQMLLLYNKTKLNDLGIRLRFAAAHQVELALSGLFPFAKVFPFGSSVNSFGKMGCDLDLVLQLDAPSVQTNSRLIFHVKPAMGINRNQVQRHMEIIGDLLQFFLPGCNQVIRILQARVPILRYKQDLMNLECDLSMTNMTAVHMTELLYLYGCYDWRVCPLIFTIRYWAKEINLTNAAPGRWITNFSLTLMVLFYLQQTKIIPPLEMLVKYRRPEDDRFSDDGTNCSYLRNVNTPIPEFSCSNKDSLAGLLFDFFQFYSTFDFSSYAISLNSGLAISKPEYSAVYIVNPLERHLNVSKNVSPEECERLLIEFRNAAWILESTHEELTEPKKEEDWGLLKLVKCRAGIRTASIRNQQNERNFKVTMKGVHRLMTVKDLFNNEDGAGDCDNTLRWNHNKKQPPDNDSIDIQLNNVKHS